MDQSKSALFKVSYPDYFIDPGSDKILIVSEEHVYDDIVEQASIVWPDRNVAFYHFDPYALSWSGTEDVEDVKERLTWLTYQAAVADRICVCPSVYQFIETLAVKYISKTVFIHEIKDRLPTQADFAIKEFRKNSYVCDYVQLLDELISKLT